ncbi:MAG: hypothetical protein M3Y87_07025 [Myxococcota bacterium]|nr:hypothetical protein [Myxococcota bacterium]
MEPRRRHERSQASQEVERVEHDGVRAVLPRALEQVAHAVLVVTLESEQVDTTTPIASEMKAYVDDVILEGRIHDAFDEDPMFREMIEAARERIGAIEDEQ